MVQLSKIIRKDILGLKLSRPKLFQTKRTPGLAHLPSLFGYGGGEVGITYSRS